MALDLVRNPSLEHVRVLSALEEAALRDEKAGTANPAMKKIYRRATRHIRDKNYWILCDCRSEGSARPRIVLRELGPDNILLVNPPNSSVPHAGSCVFRLREKQARRIVIADGFLDPFPFLDAHRNRQGQSGEKKKSGSGGLSRARDPLALSDILKRFISEARLNTLAGVERFASQEEWLPEIRRAAEQFKIAPGIPASEFLFTDPASWQRGEVLAKLEDAEERWPERRRPFGLLCWVALDVKECEVNAVNRAEGWIRASTPVISPIIYERRVKEPYLFLGAVARSDRARGWECRMAYAQPIVAPERPIPVDSDYERQALRSLPQLVHDLRNDGELQERLGGAVRVELHKPLFPFNVAGGPCVPDILVTVTRPGRSGHRPGDADRGRPKGRYEDRHTVRYIIEVMGFDDEEYEQKKENTHTRMRRIGRVIRMEGGQFESAHNDVERQRERITRQIRKDILWRWNPE